MKIVYSGHENKYLCESLALLFFQNAGFGSEEDGRHAQVSLSVRGGQLIARTDITADGRTCFAECTAEHTAESLPGKEIAERLIARSFYIAASELTGIKPRWGVLTGIRPANLAGRYLGEDYSEEQLIDYFRCEFLCEPDKAKLSIEAFRAQRRCLDLIENAGGKTASLYVSIPFCPTRCSYCSFVSHSVEKAAGLMPRYTELLIDEIERAGTLAAENGVKYLSAYVGGGTPTTLSAQLLRLVLAAVKKAAPEVLEFTVEAGRPDTIDGEKLDIILSAGAGRISINPQSLSDKTLARIGRAHSAKAFLDAFSRARKTGFKNINCDLIAGLPGESLEDFEASLEGVISLGPESITVHTLSLKRAARLKAGDASGNAVFLMVEHAGKRLREAGYLPYYIYRQKNTLGNLENVSYAKKGFDGLYNVFIMGELHTIVSTGAGGISKYVSCDRSRIERICNPKYPYEYIDNFDRVKDNCGRIFTF